MIKVLSDGKMSHMRKRNLFYLTTSECIQKLSVVDLAMSTSCDLQAELVDFSWNNDMLGWGAGVGGG